MAFTSTNEIEILGGTEAERAAAAALVLGVDCVDEATASTRDAARAEPGKEPRPFLLLKFESVDGLPEQELGPIAAEFPSLAFTLTYYSRDGEFFGYAKVGAEGDEAASEDFDEGTSDIVGRRYEGDRLAFVRERFDLPSRA
jgi:hypothetical protein